MKTTNLRFATLLARMQDAGWTVDDWGEVVDWCGSNLRLVHITDARGREVQGLVIEHADGSYKFFVQQPSPMIDCDVEFINSALRDYGALPLSPRA